MPENPSLRSLRLDCRQLNDPAIDLLVRPSLHELHLFNCERFSGRLLFEIGEKCPELRYLFLGSLAECRRPSICFLDLENLLMGCSKLESLRLAFDISKFDDPKFAQLWATASEKLTYLEIGYIPLAMLEPLLKPISDPRNSLCHLKPSVLSNIQKLCLSVDYITDMLVGSISQGLLSLTHLDLQDAPILEPPTEFDLTNAGLPLINRNGRLKHISIVRSQEFLFTYFRRVSDLGVLIMSDTCSQLESICLGGFCRVTDTGFRAILHSCPRLQKLLVSHGNQLTDLVFHDVAATSLSLTHASLRWCNHLTHRGVVGLSSNLGLCVIDLRDCRKVGDEALKALASLCKLQILLLDGADISDFGLSFLGSGSCTLVSLSVRGCKRLTDRCIDYLFVGSLGRSLRGLDLSKLPNLSDNGILSLAKTRVPITELRMRECPRIGDISVMALASMQIECGSHGSSLCMLDVFDSGGITPLAFRWFKKPYFPSLRWLGVTGMLNRDMVDALARNRPHLHVACIGEEMESLIAGMSSDWYRHADDELDEWWIDNGGDSSGNDEDEDVQQYEMGD